MLACIIVEVTFDTPPVCAASTSNQSRLECTDVVQRTEEIEDVSIIYLYNLSYDFLVIHQHSVPVSSSPVVTGSGMPERIRTDF